MTKIVWSIGSAVRRSAATGALVVLTGLLAACDGSGGEAAGGGGEDPPPSESAEAASPDDPASDDAEATEDPEDPEDLEPTPPDTLLDPDEPAIVEVVYTGSGRGLYELELVSVEEKPLSILPPDLPREQGSTLYYVTQDWTMIDRGKGNVQGMNLKAQTSVSSGRTSRSSPSCSPRRRGASPHSSARRTAPPGRPGVTAPPTCCRPATS